MFNEKNRKSGFQVITFKLLNSANSHILVFKSPNMKTNTYFSSPIWRLNTSNVKPARIVKEYYNNGQERQVITYPDSGDVFTYKREFFYENGNPCSSGFVRNGRKEGKYRSWHSNGKPKSSWEIRDGKETGFIQCWYENGLRKKECFLSRGLKFGRFNTWHENGQKESEGYYFNDKRIGQWKFWNEKGECKLITFDDGETKTSEQSTPFIAAEF